MNNTLSTSPDGMKQCDMDSYNLVFENQGGFGCIFSDTNQEYTQKYLEKHLGSQSSTEFIRKITDIEHGRNEMKIGQIVSGIPFFRDYYAVIEDYCSVYISPDALISGSVKSKKIKTKGNNENEIKKCSLLTKNKNKDKNKFISMKIPFINGVELGRYEFTNTDELLFFYDYLLTGFNILFDNNIIHYDIKDNNIMINNNKRIPIIIDFGISIDISLFYDKKTKEKKWKDNIGEINELFLSSGPYYRNIDIYILIKLLKLYDKSGTDLFTSSGGSPMIPSSSGSPMIPSSSDSSPFDNSSIGVIFNDVINFFFDINRETYDLNDYLESNDITDYKNKCIDYYSAIYLNNKKNIEDIIDILLEKIDSWDNYGLAICMMEILQNYDNNTNHTHRDTDIYTIEKLSLFLKQIISASPDKRPSLNTTQRELYQLVEVSHRY